MGHISARSSGRIERLLKHVKHNNRLKVQFLWLRCLVYAKLFVLQLQGRGNFLNDILIIMKMFLIYFLKKVIKKMVGAA